MDLTALIHSPGAGVFATLADPSLFAQARVEYGAVTWPGEVDLAPDAMYAEIKKSGKWVLQQRARRCAACATTWRLSETSRATAMSPLPLTSMKWPAMR